MKTEYEIGTWVMDLGGELHKAFRWNKQKDIELVKRLTTSEIDELPEAWLSEEELKAKGARQSYRDRKLIAEAGLEQLPRGGNTEQTRKLREERAALAKEILAGRADKPAKKTKQVAPQIVDTPILSSDSLGFEISTEVEVITSIKVTFKPMVIKIKGEYNVNADGFIDGLREYLDYVVTNYIEENKDKYKV